MYKVIAQNNILGDKAWMFSSPVLAREALVIYLKDNGYSGKPWSPADRLQRIVYRSLVFDSHEVSIPGGKIRIEPVAPNLTALDLASCETRDLEAVASSSSTTTVCLGVAQRMLAAGDHDREGTFLDLARMHPVEARELCSNVLRTRARRSTVRTVMA